jgi:hypothetical protein
LESTDIHRARMITMDNFNRLFDLPCFQGQVPREGVSRSRGQNTEGNSLLRRISIAPVYYFEQRPVPTRCNNTVVLPNHGLLDDTHGMARILGATKIKLDVILLKSFVYFREKFSGPAMSCAGIEYQQYLHDT